MLGFHYKRLTAGDGYESSSGQWTESKSEPSQNAKIKAEAREMGGTDQICRSVWRWPERVLTLLGLTHKKTFAVLSKILSDSYCIEAAGDE